MAMFKKLGFFGAPLLVLLAGASATTACSGEDVCGACGEVATGDIGISGNAKLDGFFAAVATLNTAVVNASTEFEVSLGKLEAAFGIEADAEAALDARVEALNAKISAAVTANAEAGLTVNVEPAKCQANVNVAVEAQVSCEAKAKCDVKADPGSVSVKCEGSCTGSCEGGCAADVQAECRADAGGVACEGKCEGTCQLDAAASCTGTCHGTCSGECSAYAKNAAGEAECAGSCDGECTGSCELSAAASCSGTCTGKCTVTAPEAGCDASAEAKCDGECKGECSGGCEGEATPPSASADCEASAECKGQAKAQASASLQCTPPSIQVGFAVKAGVDADVAAEFLAQMGVLKAEGAIMVGSFTKYSALIDGKVNGKVVFEPSPIASVTAGIQGVVEAGVDGSLFADIPAGKIECVIPAMEASVTMLGDITSESVATLKAQGSFVTAFSGGFKG